MTTHDLTNHDQRLSFAVAQVIAKLRNGGEVRVLGLPDVDERVNPAVELLTVDAIGELAIEHTLVEPFEEEMADRPRVVGYERELVERVAGRLPAGSQFHFVIDVAATKGVKPTRERLDAIAGWIIDEAPWLEIGSPRTAPRHQVEGGPPNLPFPVTLRRWPLSTDSQLPTFSISVARPEDLEARRRTRVERALQRKLPKLREASLAEADREAVLVLESNDIQLSNAWDIAAAAEAVSSAATWLPEWVILVESRGGPTAWILRACGEWRETIEPLVLA